VKISDDKRLRQARSHTMLIGGRLKILVVAIVTGHRTQLTIVITDSQNEWFNDPRYYYQQIRT